MKTCFKCLEAKSLDLFYRHPQTADGYLNKCKACARADTANNRDQKIEYYRSFDRARQDQPHRIAAREKYKKSSHGKQTIRTGRIAWDGRNPEKKRAHRAVQNAIRSGSMIRGCCEVCGSARAQAHHDDYKKALAVRWLCHVHHVLWHRIERKERRENIF